MAKGEVNFINPSGDVNTRIGAHWRPLVDQACAITGMTMKELGHEAVSRAPDLPQAEAIRFYVAEVLTYYGAEATLRRLGLRAERVAGVLGEDISEGATA